MKIAAMKGSPTANKRSPRPLRLDPSRTGGLRRFAAREVRQQFRKLRLAINDALLRPLAVNVFCPTGEGGGVDPTCSPPGTSGVAGAKKAKAAFFDYKVGKEDAEEQISKVMKTAKGSVEASAEVVGIDGGEYTITDAGKYETKYEDDPEIVAEGVRIEVKHEAIKECSRFVGIDENGVKFIRNEILSLKKEHRGSGIGTEIFASQVAGAIDHGIDEIRTHAAGEPDHWMNGYYTWPRLGYDGSIEDIHSQDTVSKVRAEFPEAKTIQDIYSTEEGRSWWKENGSDFEAKFDLKKGSKSLRILRTYLEERAKRAKANNAATIPISTTKKNRLLTPRGSVLTGNVIGDASAAALAAVAAFRDAFALSRRFRTIAGAAWELGARRAFAAVRAQRGEARGPREAGQFVRDLRRKKQVGIDNRKRVINEQLDRWWEAVQKRGAPDPDVANVGSENCGTGAGGFQPGNTCAKDGSEIGGIKPPTGHESWEDAYEQSPDGPGVGQKGHVYSQWRKAAEAAAVGVETSADWSEAVVDYDTWSSYVTWTRGDPDDPNEKVVYRISDHDGWPKGDPTHVVESQLGRRDGKHVDADGKKAIKELERLLSGRVANVGGMAIVSRLRIEREDADATLTRRPRPAAPKPGGLTTVPGAPKVKDVAGRLYEQIEELTRKTSREVARLIISGAVEGKSPQDVAREIAEVMEIDEAKALRIARTEIVREQAEGELDAFEEMGVEEVTAAVEWSTAGDDRVCQLCAPLEGIVLKIAEARGMLPRHPNCRCSWIDASAERGDQVRGPKAIRERIRESAEDEGIAEELEEGDEKVWGPGAPITRHRPAAVKNAMDALSDLFNGAH